MAGGTEVGNLRYRQWSRRCRIEAFEQQGHLSTRAFLQPLILLTLSAMEDISNKSQRWTSACLQ